jgi:hypothetical protein
MDEDRLQRFLFVPSLRRYGQLRDKPLRWHADDAGTARKKWGVVCRDVFDLGCGNGLYLAEFWDMSGVATWDVAPDKGGYAEVRTSWQRWV